jgi:sulfonate transport system permease protein
MSRRFEVYFGDLFAGLAQVPLVGWVPLLILVFGIEEPFRVAVIAIAAMFPIALNLEKALKRVPRSYREVADILALPLSTRLTQLYLPATLPSLVTGARLGLSKAFMIVVFAELFAASTGLGHMMDDARRQFQMDVILIGCLSVGLIGTLVDQLFAAIERRLAR